MRNAILAVASGALLIAGTAALSWPAGLIVAGLLGGGVAFWIDLDRTR